MLGSIQRTQFQIFFSDFGWFSLIWTSDKRLLKGFWVGRLVPITFSLLFSIQKKMIRLFISYLEISYKFKGLKQLIVFLYSKISRQMIIAHKIIQIKIKNPILIHFYFRNIKTTNIIYPLIIRYVILIFPPIKRTIQKMNLLSFMKKKQEKPSPDKKNPKNVRLDTQAGLVANKKSKANQRVSKQQSNKLDKTQKIQRCSTNIQCQNESVSTVYRSKKSSIKIKQLLGLLWAMKNRIQDDYQLKLNASEWNSQEVAFLLSTNYFRFRRTTFSGVLNQYCNIIQAFELLISKLSNNQKVPQTVFIKNEEDFVLFFKVFFSKPYNLINRPSVRKVIKLVWDQMVFSSLTIDTMVNNLRLWIFGISSPLNPSMNKLHQYVTEGYEDISKIVTHKSNHFVYIGVNDSDTLGLTPLMIAVISKNLKAMEKLIKNGASPSICPLTMNAKSVKIGIDQSKFGGKIMYRKQFGIRQRKQADVIELLRNDKRIEQLGQLLCWQNFYEKKVFRKNSELSQFLSIFPNCSFQIDWKQYKGMLCFKQLPQDIITIFKKDYSLRIDFHYLGEEIKKEKGHYSIILRAQPKKQAELYFINHLKKSIIDVLRDKDLQRIKEKYNNILKFGNIYNPEISDIKAIYIPDQNRLSATVESYYQNLTKYPLYSFESLKQYLNSAILSDFLNYGELQKNEFKAVLTQSIFVPPKVKSKIIASTTTIDIQWASQSLNLSHLHFILDIAQLVFPSSLSLNRLQLQFQALIDPIFSKNTLGKKLPLRSKCSFEGQTNIQSEIKNIRYCNLQQCVFKVEVKAKELNYKQSEEQVDVSHLQDTVYLEEMYSINVSRFVGRSQQMLEFEQNEANKKFEELLRLEGIWSNDQDDQK